jgi:hypothetical protein
MLHFKQLPFELSTLTRLFDAAHINQLPVAEVAPYIAVKVTFLPLSDQIQQEHIPRL